MWCSLHKEGKGKEQVMDRTHRGGDTQSIFASFFYANAAFTQLPRAGAGALQSIFLTPPGSGAGAALDGAAWSWPDFSGTAPPCGLSRRLPSGL